MGDIDQMTPTTADVMGTPDAVVRSYPDTFEGQLLRLLWAQADWRSAIALCREWYRRNCPRYTADEVECALGWVGRMMIVRKQLTDRARPEMPRWNRLTPEEAASQFAAEVAGHWADEPRVYAAHVRRWDHPVPAEVRVAEVVGRIASM